MNVRALGSSREVSLYWRPGRNLVRTIELAIDEVVIPVGGQLLKQYRFHHPSWVLFDARACQRFHRAEHVKPFGGCSISLILLKAYLQYVVLALGHFWSLSVLEDSRGFQQKGSILIHDLKMKASSAT